MLHVVRATYGYDDEYILSKPMKWLQNAYELCIRDRYNQNLELSRMVIHIYASGMSNKVKPPKEFGEMLKEMRTKKERDETSWIADDSVLRKLGLQVRRSSQNKNEKDK